MGSATPGDVELTAADSSPREADAGSALTLLFRLRNLAPARLSVQGRVELPEGWRVLVGPAPIVLEPGHTAPRLLTIVVPAGALVGSYTVRYAAWAAADSAVPATASVTVVVRERARLGLELLDAAHFVVAGEPFVVAGLLRNLGNAPATVSLRAQGSPGLQLRTDSALVHLGVGETRQLSFPVDTRGVTSREYLQHVWITATRIGEAGLDSTVTARATSEVEIVARARVGESRSHAVPLSLAVGRLDQSSAGAYLGHDDTVELSGGGSLAEGGATNVELFARRSRTTLSGLAVRDEFHLALSGPDADLRIGDYSFGFSPLTETARVATGAAARARRGRWSAGAFAIRDRGHGTVPLNAEAAFVGVRITPDLELSVNAIARHDSGTGSVASLRTVFTTASLGSFDVEAALSRGSASGGGFAWALRAHGAPGGFGYEVRRIQGDRSYVGPFQGTRQDNVSVTTPARYPLVLEGQISSQFVGRDVLLSHPDSLPGTTLSSQRSQSTSLGLTWQGWLQVERRTVKQEASYAGQDLGGDETALQARASARMGRALQLSGEIARGTSRNALTDPEQRFWRYIFRSQLSIGSSQSYGASVERQFTAQSGSVRPLDRLTIELSANLRLRTGTNLHLLGSVNRGPGYSLAGPLTPASFATALYDATLTQRLPLDHLATVRVRSVFAAFLPAGGQKIVQVEYRVPIGIPGGGSRTAGQVVALVRDAETGRGLPNVVVRLDGQPVVTDRSGRAEFRGLVSKGYYLQVDRASLGTGRISDLDQATLFQVSGDHTTRVIVTVTRAARIAGQVRRWNYSERRRLEDTAGTAIIETGGVAGMDIDLDNGSEVLRQVTDADGAFAFEDLPPGRWVVRVVGGATPELHYLAPDSTIVFLPAAGAAAVSFKVLPRRRAIRIVPPPDAAPVHLYLTGHEDQTLADVARHVYDDRTLWPKLWLANRDRVQAPDRLRPGLILVVPPPGALSWQERAAARAFPSIQ